MLFRVKFSTKKLLEITEQEHVGEVQFIFV